MFGPSAPLEDIIKKVREEILMEDPALMDSYLGCHHTFNLKGDVQKTTFDMSKHFVSKVESSRPNGRLTSDLLSHPTWTNLAQPKPSTTL